MLVNLFLSDAVAETESVAEETICSTTLVDMTDDGVNCITTVVPSSRVVVAAVGVCKMITAVPLDVVVEAAEGVRVMATSFPFDRVVMGVRTVTSERIVVGTEVGEAFGDVTLLLATTFDEMADDGLVLLVVAVADGGEVIEDVETVPVAVPP